jgi:hypothetical protein
LVKLAAVAGRPEEMLNAIDPLVLVVVEEDPGTVAGPPLPQPLTRKAIKTVNITPRGTIFITRFITISLLTSTFRIL